MKNNKYKSWKPSVGDRYWYISVDGSIDYYCWENDSIDFLFYKLGNCYKTARKAEANRDKWVAFYTSDKVLEIQRALLQNCGEGRLRIFPF